MTGKGIALAVGVGGEMTPTLEIRRHSILARYRETLEELY